MKPSLLIPAVMLLCCVARPARAQSAEAEVRAVVERLFDGMRAGDSTAVRSVFHPEAQMRSVGVRDGSPVLLQGSVGAFVKAVGTPHDEAWDERIWNVEIRVDGGLATAWMNYAFYLDDAFSHCGVNAFQLFRAPEGWQVINITDTRRRDGCEQSSRTE
jgi:hypothetical protein